MVRGLGADFSFSVGESAAAADFFALSAALLEVDLTATATATAFSSEKSVRVALNCSFRAFSVSVSAGALIITRFCR